MSKRSFILPVLVLILVASLVWQNGIADSPGRISPAIGAGSDSRGYLPQSITGSMKVRAFPLNAIAARDGEQTIYILVQDQRFNPIPDVEITLIIRYPGGSEDRFIGLQRTNTDGFTQYSFSYHIEYVGNALIMVSANRGNLTSQTSTSFMIWW